MVRMESPPSAGSSTSSRRDGGGVLARECEGGSAVWSCKRARSSAAWRCMQSPCETRSVGAGVRNGRRAHERVVFGTGAVMAHEGAAITGCGDAKRRLSRPLGARRSTQTGWAGNGQDRRDERERHLNHRCPLSFDGLSAQSARSNASESRGAVSITPVRGEMSLLGGDARPSGFQRPGARGGRVDLAPPGRSRVAVRGSPVLVEARGSALGVRIVGGIRGEHSNEFLRSLNRLCHPRGGHDSRVESRVDGGCSW